VHAKKSPRTRIVFIGYDDVIAKMFNGVYILDGKEFVAFLTTVFFFQSPSFKRAL
jgi:hypothetical protein